MFSPEFLLTSLIVVLIPGTGVVYTISTGLFVGWRASIAAAIGCTAGVIPHLLAGILGLCFVLHMGAVVFQTIKLAGVVYLLYLAWNMWREEGRLSLNPKTPKSAGEIITKAFLINILNPKLTLFFFSFLPLFLSAKAGSTTVQMLELGLVFMLITLVVFAVYGILASSVSRQVARSPRVITLLQRSFAAVFATLGVKLALTQP